MSSAPGPKGPPNVPPVLGRPLGMPMVVLLILAAVALATFITGNVTSTRAPLRYDEFVEQVRQGNVTEITLTGDHLEGTLTKPLEPDEAAGRKGGTAFELDLNPITVLPQGCWILDAAYSRPLEHSATGGHF